MPPAPCTFSERPTSHVRCACTRLIHAGSASHRPIPRIFHAQQPYTHRTHGAYMLRSCAYRRAWGEEAGPLRRFSRMLTRVRLTAVDDSDVWAGATCLIRTRQGLQLRPLHCGDCGGRVARLCPLVYTWCIAVEFCLLVVFSSCVSLYFVLFLFCSGT